MHEGDATHKYNFQAVKASMLPRQCWKFATDSHHNSFDCICAVHRVSAKTNVTERQFES